MGFLMIDDCRSFQNTFFLGWRARERHGELKNQEKTAVRNKAPKACCTSETIAALSWLVQSHTCAENLLMQFPFSFNQTSNRKQQQLKPLINHQSKQCHRQSAPDFQGKSFCAWIQLSWLGCWRQNYYWSRKATIRMMLIEW